MNLECLNVLHEITVESHPVSIITAYTGAYLNTLTRRQIVKTSGTISLQVKISISLYQFIFETIPLNQSQYSFLLDNIHVPLLWTSPCRNFHVCTHNIYRFIDCLCMGSHISGMLPYVHVGHPKLRQLWALVKRTVIISQHDSASSLQSPI